MRLFTILLFMLFFSCKSKPIQQNAEPVKNNDIERIDSSFYTVLKSKFNLIDSLRQLDPQKLDSLSESLISFLEQNKETILNLHDTLNFDLLYISKSNDRNLCLVSWDTRTGGTMIDYATLAIFKTSLGVKSKLLRDTTAEMGDTFMHYDSIYAITCKNNKDIYLAQGFGQGSTALSWQEIRAFSIIADTLSMPKIFPGNSANIFVEFDTHKFADSDRVPTIKSKDFSKTILVPEATENEGFANQFKTLTFFDDSCNYK